MKRRNYPVLLALLFVSCNKLLDYFPNPHGGLPVFNHVFGGSAEDEARSLIGTPDGGYLIAASSHSKDGIVNKNKGYADAWIIKLDKNGNRQWQQVLGGSEFDRAMSAATSPDGGYIMAGGTQSNNGDISGNHGNGDILVVKLSEQGQVEWKKVLGGSGYEDAKTITTATDGGYILAGTTNESFDGDVSGNHGSADAWIIKLDWAGNIEWQKTIGGSDYENVGSLAKTADGGYVICGGTYSRNGDMSENQGNADAWIAKLNQNGTIKWLKTYGGAAFDFAASIIESKEGGYVMAGSKGDPNEPDITKAYDAWIVKLYAAGNVAWEKTMGGSNQDMIFGVTESMDGGFVMAGNTLSNDGAVSGAHKNGDNEVYDAWVIKLDRDGTKKWQKPLGGSNADIANFISTRPDGSYVIAGSTNSNDGDVRHNYGSTDAWVLTLKDR